MSSGSDPSFLYGGGRLELTESWVVSSGFELTDDERRFLATSRDKVDRDHVVRTRRRRIIVGALAAALVIALVGAAVALVQRNNADREAANAEQQQQEAERQAALADEQRASEADRRRHARRVPPHQHAGSRRGRLRPGAPSGRRGAPSRRLAGDRDNLLATIQRSPYAIAVIRSDTQAFLDLGFTADGTLLAGGAGAPSTLSKYDVTTREPAGVHPTAEPRLSSAVSPDGRLAAMSSTGEDGTALDHAR